MKSTAYNVGSWIPGWARRVGDHPAIVEEGRTLSYAELDERTAKLAGALLAGGIGPRDRVGVLLTNRSAYLETVFAACRIGAICVPINTRLSPREVAFLFDDCTPGALILESELKDLVEKAGATAQHTPALRLETGGQPDTYEAALDAATPETRVVPLSPEDPMMLMYTSGTTGEPKGALLPHRKALFNSLNAGLVFALRRDDRVLVASPLFHSLGLQIISLPALYAGSTLILRRRFDPELLWQTIKAERASYLGTVPTVYQALADRVELGASTIDMSSLRFCFTAGAAVSVQLIQQFERHGIVLKQGYGQTETSMLCCLEERDAVRKAGSVGKPVFHAELRVVALEGIDQAPDAWHDVQPGETGEIVVRGPITMLEYWKRPRATAETLREDGWLRTNDLATVDDEGFVTLVGRARDMYISGGENVYPAEVEAVFCEHESVLEIAVVGIPHPRWGETGRAHVVLREGKTLDADALLEWGRERLARFKLPEHFVVETALPRTASGKVQKHRLADPVG